MLKFLLLKWYGISVIWHVQSVLLTYPHMPAVTKSLNSLPLTSKEWFQSSTTSYHLWFSYHNLPCKLLFNCWSIFSMCISIAVSLLKISVTKLSALPTANSWHCYLGHSKNLWWWWWWWWAWTIKTVSGYRNNDVKTVGGHSLWDNIQMTA